MPGSSFEAADILADLKHVTGDYPGAVKELLDALPLLERIDAPTAKAAALFEAAQAVLRSGDPARALELGEGSSQLARHMSAHDQMHATSVIMTAADWLGDWDRVESALAEHLANFDQEANVHCLNVQSGPNRGALVVARRGDPARARGLAERTIPFELDARPDPVHRGRCARRGGRRGSRAENRRGRDGARAPMASAGGCCGSDPRA